MSHEEIMQRMIASSGLSWDAYTESGTTYDELDATLIEQFIKAAKIHGRRSIPEQISGEEFLRKLELIRDRTPTRAALLLFGKNPQAHFPSAFLKIGRFRSLTHIIDDRESYGALLKQLEEVMSWFRERLSTEFIISNHLEREVHWEYPLNAIREAIINVLCHRDYTSAAHSQIRLYDDRLEFWNAGHLPSSLTTASLFTEHDSIPRNRKIADVFYYMGLIERWGSGTLRIAEELEQAQLPKPEFFSEQGHFRVIFKKQIAFLSDPTFKTLSQRQQKALEFVKEHGSINNTEYRNMNQVSKSTATRELNDLKVKNFLDIEGSTGRGTIYRLHKGLGMGSKDS
jgi:ATP-dependent DNA helicase RecG